jgi:hypothetical protein
MCVLLDHVGNRSSPKLREFEIRQVGSRREGVLIIGAMALAAYLSAAFVVHNVGFASALRPVRDVV